ncbi:MAG: TfoX/Sxy family protein [Anaerolineales bacterium]|nr:TfoX/Sxy family protein [Anaerolineales bacterium]
MASDINFVEYVVGQLEHLGEVSARKMFGEYAIYHKEKLVALVCDNQVFVKPTQAGRAFMGDVVEAPPYPGAKPSFLMGDQVEDKEWLGQLIRLTEKELPAPKPKKEKKPAGG